MKKSLAYKIAQMSVLSDDDIPNEKKLEILSILMDDERLAVFTERQEVEQG